VQVLVCVAMIGVGCQGGHIHHRKALAEASVQVSQEECGRVLGTVSRGRRLERMERCCLESLVLNAWHVDARNDHLRHGSANETWHRRREKEGGYGRRGRDGCNMGGDESHGEGDVVLVYSLVRPG